MDDLQIEQCAVCGSEDVAGISTKHECYRHGGHGTVKECDEVGDPEDWCLYCYSTSGLFSREPPTILGMIRLVNLLEKRLSSGKP